MAKGAYYGHIPLTDFLGEPPEWEDSLEVTKRVVEYRREEQEAWAEMFQQGVKAVIQAFAEVGKAIIKSNQTRM